MKLSAEGTCGFFWLVQEGIKVQLARYNSQGTLSASVRCPSKWHYDQEVPHGLSPLCSTAKAVPQPGAERWHFQTQLFPPRRLLGGVCLFHPGGQEKALFDRGKQSQLPTAVLLPPHTLGASHLHCLSTSQLHGSFKHRLTFLGNDRIHLMLSVWSEYPMTVYFNHLAAFNSSWQCHEAASPAGQAIGTVAPWRAGIL